jgi:uncharacterized protein
MKTFGRYLLALVFLGAMAGSSYAFDVPVLRGRVNDYANLLTPDQRATLEATLRGLEEKTSAQVAILTVTSLQGLDVGGFSMKVVEAWKLGQKGKDNGLLIMYSTDGDHYRIEVGYGLEGAIPDGLAGNILRQQLRAKADPKHGTKDFYGAFTDAVARINGIIAAEYAKDATGASMRGVDHTKLIIVIVLTLVIVMICGFIHYIFGGVVGGIGGAVVAMVGLMSTGYFILLVLIGILIGLIIKAVVEDMAQGSFSSSFFDSDGGGGFSGGGGDFGGGGAGD